jgi:hypothetical protein
MQENYDQDVEDTPVVNSANDPFSNPLVRDRGGITLTVTQNEQTFNGSTALQYCNCVNSNSFMGADPSTLKVTIGATNVWDQKYGMYWTVVYTFEYNANTWDQTVLDCGFYKVDGVKKTLCLDHNNVPATTPVLLDGAGGQLAADGTPSYMTFKPYQAVTFSFSLR